MAEATITLGGREFAVKMLPLTQLLEVADILEDTGIGEGLKGSIERGTRIISVALRFADPSMTENNVRAIAAPLDDLTAATRTILEIAGIRREGEAVPAASSANSSTG